MKHVIVITIIIWFTNVSNGQNPKLDEKNGFKWFKFGMNEDSIKKVAKNPEKDVYIIENNPDLLKIGETPLEKIIIFFHKGQLYSIDFRTKGYSKSIAVLQALEQAYGKGYKSNQYIEKYSWFGDKVSMSYNRNSITDDAAIFMYSVDIYKQIKKEDAEKSKKAEGDL